jgi:hypothetical protein
MDVTKNANWNRLVACLGLFACADTWRLGRVLHAVIPTGEMSLIRGLSMIFGVLLLAVACLRLLMKDFTHGKMFAIAAGLMLINLIHFYDWSVYSYRLGPCVAMALLGAVMGFRVARGARFPAAEEPQ